MSALCCVTFSYLYGLTEYAVVGTAPGDILTVGMLVSSLGLSQMLSLGHQCESNEVRAHGCSIHTPGPTVGSMEGAQILA